jgi:Ca-activated chloride channel family protein
MIGPSGTGGWGFYAIRALPVVSLFVFGGGVLALPAVQNTDEEPYRVAVDVNLVVLHATVTDRAGHPVSGLQRNEFQVYEDGVPQRIGLFQREDIPVTVGLVVDHSGSMGPKLRDVMAAAETFARSSNPNDQMFVADFNERVWFGLAAGVAFTGDASQLEAAISRGPASGRTALYDAIVESLTRLNEGNRKKRVLLVISDGGDNASRHSLPQVIRKAEESSAIIYAIGLFNEDDPDRNPGVLRRLARVTGGEAFFPRETAEAVGICERIAKDIRNQYTLGYVAAVAPADLAFRAIRVVARAPHYGRLFVRTRTGYIPAVGKTAAGQPPGGTEK